MKQLQKLKLLMSKHWNSPAFLYNMLYNVLMIISILLLNIWLQDYYKSLAIVCVPFALFLGLKLIDNADKFQHNQILFQENSELRESISLFQEKENEQEKKIEKLEREIAILNIDNNPHI